MNILVLDMDGVINSTKLCRQWINNRFSIQEKNPNNLTLQDIRKSVADAYKKQFNYSKQLVFPQLASMIKQICEQCDAYIVWSSTWRRLPQYQDINQAKQMFNRRGLPGDRLISYTKSRNMHDGGYRSYVINQWINENKDKYKVEKVAVIDDRWDAGFNLNQQCKFFQTDEGMGITQQIKNNIIEYFKN